VGADDDISGCVCSDEETAELNSSETEEEAHALNRRATAKMSVKVNFVIIVFDILRPLSVTRSPVRKRDKCGENLERLNLL